MLSFLTLLVNGKAKLAAVLVLILVTKMKSKFKASAALLQTVLLILTYVLFINVVVYSLPNGLSHI